MNGAEIVEREFIGNCAPHSLQKVATLDAFTPSDQQSQFIVIGYPFSWTFWFFDIDKNLHYPEPKWTATVNGNTLKIEAHTFLRDFYVNADRFGGTLKENLVTFLPGDVWEVEIEGVSPEALAKVDFSQRPIVNCANYFGTKR